MLYYLLTPLFALLDFALGVNVRAAFLPSAAARAAWYAFSFACGLVAWRKPGLAARVGMIESGANIILLVTGVYGAVFNAGEDLIERGTINPLLTPGGMTNVALSAAMLAISFYSNKAAVDRRAGSA